jgi:hypothetical protein
VESSAQSDRELDRIVDLRSRCPRYGLSVVLAEVGYRLEVRHQAAGQPHQLDVALALPLQAPARLHPVEVAVDVNLQQRRWMVGRPSGHLWLDTAEPELTGLTLMGPDLDGLRLSMLKEAIPTAKRIAVIYNPDERPSVQELRQTEIGAANLGIVLQPVEARGGDALDQAFTNAVAGGADAFITFAHPSPLPIVFGLLSSPHSTACLGYTAGASMPKPAV